MSATDALVTAGATAVRISLPTLRHVNASLTVISAAESADVHRERLAESTDAYLPGTLHRLRLGRDYVRARRIRGEIADAVAEAIRSVNMLVSPICPTTAPRFADIGVPADDATAAGLPQLARVCNLTGGPAIRLPCGRGADGMLIGLQIAGAPGCDREVLASRCASRRSRAWHAASPPDRSRPEKLAPATGRSGG